MCPSVRFSERSTSNVRSVLYQSFVSLFVRAMTDTIQEISLFGEVRYQGSRPTVTYPISFPEAQLLNHLLTLHPYFITKRSDLILGRFLSVIVHVSGTSPSLGSPHFCVLPSSYRSLVTLPFSSHPIQTSPTVLGQIPFRTSGTFKPKIRCVLFHKRNFP